MLTISQLARYAGVTVRAVRHYHKIGLLPEPERDRSGYRTYDAAAVVRLIRIHTLADAGVPLARVQELLDAGAEEFTRHVREIDRKLRAEIRRLQGNRTRIARLAAGEHLALPQSVVDYLDRLRGLGVNEQLIEMERDAWIMVAAQAPDVIDAVIAKKHEDLDVPDVVKLYRLASEAADWEVDDPRVVEIADTIERLGIRAVEAGEVGGDDGIDDGFANLLDVTMLESSPHARRVVAILEKRGWKGWTRIEAVPADRLGLAEPGGSPGGSPGDSMEKVDYDARLHAVYAAGRQLSPDAQRTWMSAFARHLPAPRPLAWLDLGSGTGRMTPALASAFGGPVYGVEPSDKMRAQAVAHAGHPAVTYAAGSAEQIPLPDASCDAALLFFVWHHVANHDAAAQELRRVVKPGGKLFVQANFSDRMPDVWWFRVMPEWKEIDSAQFGSEEEVKHDFTRTGWTLVSQDAVTWVRSASLADDYERLKLRSVSAFELMGEEVAEAGFARIEAALPTLDDGPQYETSELLVFQR